MVVKNPKKIIVFFIALAVAGAIMQNFVRVNYDMKDYLPKESHSTVSLDIMSEEFSGGIPNARVMICDVTIPEALNYKERLEACQGVDEVLWLDDVVNIYQPLEFADADTVESYYKDNAALFTITIDKKETIEAVAAIREVIGSENAMSGDAVSTAVATTGTVSEIRMITVIAITVVFLVLLLTTNSWMEPLIVLLGLGVSIMINNGTNLIFGEISFVTNAAGTVLQLAVSLDYAVFLIHQYEECLHHNSNRSSAMVDALCKSGASIFSSGLTTVIGFLALLFMRFGLGPDLGLALAKGIGISLVTVFVFMPALILKLYPLMLKTRHKSLMPSFKTLSRIVCRIMIPLVCAFAIMVLPFYLASNNNQYYYGSAYIYGEDTKFGKDVLAIESVFGKNNTYVILLPNGDFERENQLSDALHKIPEVTSIISYVDTVGAEIPKEYLDEETLSQLISDNYSRMVLNVETDYEGEAAFALVEKIRETANEYYPGAYYLAGEGVSTYDLMDTITADTIKVNLIAMGAVVVVLLFMMKSLSLPLILVFAIETAIWINMGVPYFMDSVVFYIAYLIISSVQLGATVDYAILFTDHYMEFRRYMNKREAVGNTVSAVAVSLLTSGTVLASVGFLLGYLSTHGILSQIGMLLGRGTLLSTITVFFVLPGMLYLFDGLIKHTTLKADFYVQGKEYDKDEAE